MIQVKEHAKSNVVEIEVDGHITAREFDDILERLEAIITDRGEIRLLEVIGTLETPPIPWSKFWDDIKFGFSHLSDITHVAVVADQGWILTYVDFLNPFFRAEMQCFKRDEIETARIWLENAE